MALRFNEYSKGDRSPTSSVLRSASRVATLIYGSTMLFGFGDEHPELISSVSVSQVNFDLLDYLRLVAFFRFPREPSATLPRMRRKLRRSRVRRARSARDERLRVKVWLSPEKGDDLLKQAAKRLHKGELLFSRCSLPSWLFAHFLPVSV